jgi:intraflagellar transport protein 74
LIQDCTYFQTELRQKVGILTQEIARLSISIEQTNKENTNYASFEAKADALAEDLRDLQGQLGDYNTLLDKIHTGTNLNEIGKHIDLLKAQNQNQESKIDEIFTKRQKLRFANLGLNLRLKIHNIV